MIYNAKLKIHNQAIPPWPGKISRKDQGNLFDVILLFFVENLNLILIIKF